mgnify:FL=1
MDKFIKPKKLKPIFILSFLLFIYIFICAYNYAYAISTDLSETVFRLHVIANSDSTEDQNLKYKVRDNIINYMKDLCMNCSSKQDVIECVQNNINKFQNLAQQTVYDNGYNYPVNVKIGNFKFPTKTYGDISFPSGEYDALRIEIGSAKGKNWWCMLYPSLCFVDVSSGIVPDDSKETLQSSLSNEEYLLVSDSENKIINFKFKLVELFNNNLYIASK